MADSRPTTSRLSTTEEGGVLEADPRTLPTWVTDWSWRDVDVAWDFPTEPFSAADIKSLDELLGRRVDEP